jgi:hypothetical protein
MHYKRGARARRLLAGKSAQADAAPVGLSERSIRSPPDALPRAWPVLRWRTFDGSFCSCRRAPTRSSWGGTASRCASYLDGSPSVHASGGGELARSAVLTMPPKLRERELARAPISGTQPLPGARQPAVAEMQCNSHPMAARRRLNRREETRLLRLTDADRIG